MQMFEPIGDVASDYIGGSVTVPRLSVLRSEYHGVIIFVSRFAALLCLVLLR